MDTRKFPRKLLAHSLMAVLGASAFAQSPGDLARKERQEKASAAQSDTPKQRTINNVDSPRPQADTERPDMPVSLWQPNEGGHFLEAQGQTVPLLIAATFPDGAVRDVRESKNLIFHSTDTKIVTVDASGIIMAVTTGRASIIVSYRNHNGPDLKLTVPVTVERFQLTLEPGFLDFGKVPVGKSASLSVTVTNNSFSDRHLQILRVTVAHPELVDYLDATGQPPPARPYSETDNCISSSPLGVGNACVITVTFTPEAAGRSQGKLSVSNSSSGVPSAILVSGIGVK